MIEDKREEINLKDRQAYLDKALVFSKECRLVINSAISRGLQVTSKPDKSLVTTADIEAEKLFREKAAKAFPDFGVIGEEMGASNPAADFQWIVDPIDGSSELANGIPLYGTITALHYKGQPLIGVIDHPAFNSCCYGAYGLGAFCDGKRIFLNDIETENFDGTERVATATRSNFMRYGDEAQIFDTLVQAHPNIRIYFSCYIHTCAITGAVDAAVEWNVRIWDIAATQLLIEEAGGKYQSVRQTEQPGVGTVYCAVFGKPKLVSEIVELLKL
jgi:fructose-1,6-bisphosphatase/inositol monophosphatase family enzyme